jgi:glutathione S-transferase
MGHPASDNSHQHCFEMKIASDGVAVACGELQSGREMRLQSANYRTSFRLFRCRRRIADALVIAINHRETVMKLYYSPLACSLADHIALEESGATFESEAVDLKTKKTASGKDFIAINRKGCVPALVLHSGDTLTENVAVLDWIATQYPALGIAGPLGRTRLLEALTFVSTEVHRSFRPLWSIEDESEKAIIRLAITELLDFFADDLSSDYLFGNQPTVADFYLFVMLLWSVKFGVGIPPPLVALHDRMLRRPAVQLAMMHEGLI